MNDQPAPGALRTAISAAVDQFQSGMLHSEKVDLVMEGLSGVCFTTPNPLLEGVELREAYARIVCRAAERRIEIRKGTELDALVERNWKYHVSDADQILALKATPLIGLSQGEGERDAYGWKHHWDRLDRPRTCTNCGYVQHDGSGIGYYECPSNPAGLSLPGRDAEALATVESALLKAHGQFTFYVEQHLAKGTDEGNAKANVNANFASDMAIALKAVRALSTVQDGSVREGRAALHEWIVQTAVDTLQDSAGRPFLCHHRIWDALADAILDGLAERGFTLSTLPQSPAPISGDAS